MPYDVRHSKKYPVTKKDRRYSEKLVLERDADTLHRIAGRLERNNVQPATTEAEKLNE